MAVCINGTCDGDTDLSNGGVGSATGNSDIAGPGLAGSTARQMNLLFLVY